MASLGSWYAMNLEDVMLIRKKWALERGFVYLTDIKSHLDDSKAPEIQDESESIHRISIQLEGIWTMNATTTDCWKSPTDCPVA